MRLRFISLDFTNFLTLLLFVIAVPGTVHAQDTAFARSVIDTLTSEYMGGRGYVEQGDMRAAQYLAAWYKEIGLASYKPIVTPDGRSVHNYFQDFELPVVTFPGKMEARINKKKLVPGKDFILDPNSSGTSGKMKARIVEMPREALRDLTSFADFASQKKMQKRAVLIDEKKFANLIDDEMLVSAKGNVFDARALIIIPANNRLTYGVGTQPLNYPVIIVDSNAVPEDPKKLKLKIESEFVPRYKSQNVIGYISGRKYPDSVIVFTAHYDHLGRMGSDTYFPGGNDNGSGIALMLDLARHFASYENRPDYSIAFMAFGGEEAGLVGSKYYTENPLFPLNNIAFLINIDLMGSGEDGVMVVNGAVFKEEYENFERINDENEYLPEVKKRGKAANSDHYFFTEAGVPAFFLYLMGSYKEYHTIYDKNEMTLKGYHGTFNLLEDYTDWLQNRFVR
ncbi:MAG: M28 family peptidase [Bacteroidia bacterium]